MGSQGLKEAESLSLMSLSFLGANALAEWPKITTQSVRPTQLKRQKGEWGIHFFLFFFFVFLFLSF